MIIIYINKKNYISEKEKKKKKKKKKKGGGKPSRIESGLFGQNCLEFQTVRPKPSGNSFHDTLS
jgi:hypothetical protein